VTFLDSVLDASVLLSFDRTGFRRHAKAFVPRDLQIDLTGKVILITGANSGLGFATTRRLAALGAQVWMLCRDQARGQAALDTVRAELPKADLRLAHLDVSRPGDIDRFTATFDGPVDVLVNNAGAMPELRQVTPEGHELTFATNVLGPFLLIDRLCPALRARHGRVVTVSSGGMYTQALSLKVLQSRFGNYDPLVAYAQTKRAEVILNELWAAREPGITFAAMHPGWADTPSVRASLPTFYKWMKPILRTPEEGADTIVWLAACERIREISGLFWFDRTIAATRITRLFAEPPGKREALWQLLEGLAARPDVPAVTAP